MKRDTVGRACALIVGLGAGLFLASYDEDTYLPFVVQDGGRSSTTENKCAYGAQKLHRPYGSNGSAEADTELRKSLRGFGIPGDASGPDDCALDRTLQLSRWVDPAAALEYVMDCHAVDGVILFTTLYARSGNPILDWMPNWLEGVKRSFPAGFATRRLIVGADERSCAALAEVGVHGCVADGSHWWQRRNDIADASGKGHIATSLKFLYAHAALRRGYTVLFADADVVWTGRGDVIDYLMGPKRRISHVVEKVAAAALLPSEAAAVLNGSMLPSTSPLPVHGNTYVIGTEGLPDIQQISDYTGCPQPHMSRSAAGSHDWREALYDHEIYKARCPVEADYVSAAGSFTCMSTGLWMLQPSDRMHAFMDDVMAELTAGLQWEQSIYNHKLWKYVAGNAPGAVPPEQALSLVMLDARVIGNVEEAACGFQTAEGALDWRLPKSPAGVSSPSATPLRLPVPPPQLAVHFGYVNAHEPKLWLAQEGGYWLAPKPALLSANVLLRQRSIQKPLLQRTVSRPESTSVCMYLIAGGASDGRALAVPNIFETATADELAAAFRSTPAAAELVPVMERFPLSAPGEAGIAGGGNSSPSPSPLPLPSPSPPPITGSTVPKLPAADGACSAAGPWSRFTWELLPVARPESSNTSASAAETFLLAHTVATAGPSGAGNGGAASLRAFIALQEDHSRLRLVSLPAEATPLHAVPCELRFDGYIGLQLPMDMQPVAGGTLLQLFGQLEGPVLRAVHAGRMNGVPHEKGRACWLPVQ